MRYSSEARVVFRICRLPRGNGGTEIGSGLVSGGTGGMTTASEFAPGLPIDGGSTEIGRAGFRLSVLKPTCPVPRLSETLVRGVTAAGIGLRSENSLTVMFLQRSAAN